MNSSASRPADMPGPDRFAHGTRSRYVTGCRCAECRAANTLAYHERQQRAKAALAELGRRAATSGPCPGVNGKPCAKGSRLYSNSKGGLCGGCRDQLVWNGLIGATRVRRHLQKLSLAGVGYKSVADAADVGHTALFQIMGGTKKRIRQQAATRVLAVTAEAIADHAVVDGAATWALLDELIARGMRKAEIARRLGMKTPALQLRRGRVLARTAHAVARMYRLASAPVASPAAAVPQVCTCQRGVPFELDGEFFCMACDLRAKPSDADRLRQTLEKGL